MSMEDFCRAVQNQHPETNLIKKENSPINDPLLIHSVCILFKLLLNLGDPTARKHAQHIHQPVFDF